MSVDAKARNDASPPTLSANLASSQRNHAYLAQSLELHRRTLANALTGWRHFLNLTSEWLLGPLLAKPLAQRFRRITWTIDEPIGRPLRTCGPSVFLCGTLRDIDGRPPKRVFAQLGRRVVQGAAKTRRDGTHTWIVRFRTRPGFKFVRLFAELDCGVTIPLGFRLFLCRAEWHPHTAQLRPPPPPEAILLPPSESPRVSIIIPVYNLTAFTLRCLENISEHTALACEVIVVDDCSTEREIAALSRVARLRVHRNRENLGFVRSCNAGAELARGEFLVFLNNDTEVESGWLEALLSTFALHADAGLVGAKLVYPDGSLQEAGGIIWRDGSGWNYGRDDDPERPHYNFVRRTDYCSGACVMVRRELFAQLGGFDLRFAPAYYEDTDLAFQVRAAGREVYYQPRAVVLHHEGRSNGTDLAQGVKRHQVINRAKFIEKWHTTLERDHGTIPSKDVFRARERSRHRPTILFIDHYLPRPDRDAGSRSMRSILELFLAEGFSVKFLPDNFAAEEPYASDLQQRGIEVLAGPWMVRNWEAWLAENGQEIDYVFFSRANVTLRFLETVRRHSNARRLFYGHDLLSRTFARASATHGDAHAANQARRWKRMEQDVFASVDVVYYPSCEEVAAIRQENPRVTARMIPAFVFPEAAPENTSTDRTGLLFVGGFQHAPNVDAMTWFVRAVWPALVAQHNDLTLTIAGSHPPAEITALGGRSITVTGYVTDTELTALYRRHQIVIAPLRIGGGVKGKVVEALWQGVPVVTTPIGAEGIPDIATAANIASPEDFREAVSSLLNSPTQRDAQVEAGRRLIAQHFSPAALKQALSEHIRFPRP